MDETSTFNHFFINTLRGGCVGSLSITVATPMMNGINHLLAKERANYLIKQGLPAVGVPEFTLRRMFDGLLCYNVSVYPMVGLSLPLNQHFLCLISMNQNEPGILEKSKAAGLSGFIAGAVGAPSEGVAQALQLHVEKPRARKVVCDVLQYNGVFALGRGTLPVMARQAQFSLGFMVWMPYFSAYFRKKTNETFFADLLAAVACGIPMGPLTAPWNTLRFERQKYFDRPGPPQSYASIFRQALTPGSNVKLTNGYKPRMVMSTSSMFILHKGKEVYDRTVSSNRP